MPAMIAGSLAKIRSWFGVAFRAIDDAHAVFDGHEMWTRRLNVDFGAAQAGQDERGADR